MTAPQSPPPLENIKASLLVFLSGLSALTTVVPTTRWLEDGADDQATQSQADWIQPTVLDVVGIPSRASKHGNVLVDIKIGVRRGTDLYRREQIATAVSNALANAYVDVKEHAGGNPSTVVGYLRLFDPRFTNGGMVSGIHRGTVDCDGLFTPV